jgi:hypothetical protein
LPRYMDGDWWASLLERDAMTTSHQLHICFVSFSCRTWNLCSTANLNIVFSQLWPIS